MPTKRNSLVSLPRKSEHWPTISVSNPTNTAGSSTKPKFREALLANPQVITDTAETDDGYNATFTITYHPVTALEDEDFSVFSNCDTGHTPAPAKSSQPQVARRGIVVNIRADFPTVNGFPWRQDQPVVANAYTGGGSFLCTEESEESLNAVGSSIKLAPGKNGSVNFLLFQETEITPKNPNGSFSAERTIYPTVELSASNTGMKCGTYTGPFSTCKYDLK